MGKQFKRIRIYYLTPLGNKKETVLTAPPGCGYTEEQVQTQAAFSLKKAQDRFPRYNWRAVQIAPNIFNMIGERRDEDDESAEVSDIERDREKAMLETGSHPSDLSDVRIDGEREGSEPS